MFEELEKLRENAWPQYKKQLEEWIRDIESQGLELVNVGGDPITEEDIEAEYKLLSDETLYDAYDPDVSGEYVFNFNFDDYIFVYIEDKL